MQDLVKSTMTEGEKFDQSRQIESVTLQLLDEMIVNLDKWEKFDQELWTVLAANSQLQEKMRGGIVNLTS
jgi:hypothetical protein